VSGYPLVLDGETLSALVVGGGRVAHRKVRSLLAAGADVRVVAPEVCDELLQLAVAGDRLTLSHRSYEPRDLDDALLIIAATGDSALNARVAGDARARGRLVNVVDAPELGNCVTPAAHVAGDIVIAVSAGGVPSIAARIRDEIADRFDARYASIVSQLSRTRRQLIDAGARERWQALVAAVVDEGFCQAVEAGELAARIAPWQ
jgi:precorrin-2 dehydrogenase/sirohydrochlorin ferrochelatase